MANCIAGDYQNETYDRKCHGSVFIESLITLLYSVFYLNCICNLYLNFKLFNAIFVLVLYLDVHICINM